MFDSASAKRALAGYESIKGEIKGLELYNHKDLEANYSKAVAAYSSIVSEKS